eukprot:TRINITY_DN1892_c0_g1_i1.p1 TRINITY_DN1892_c0_g1~~TRINITY_DN1892_c0_g1_i1.p1  ORF type:complete len:307 (-),score=79.50 TRINITY_DN1892_c0_g1_i1:133-1053(-)
MGGSESKVNTENNNTEVNNTVNNKTENNFNTTYENHYVDETNYNMICIGSGGEIDKKSGEICLSALKHSADCRKLLQNEGTKGNAEAELTVQKESIRGYITESLSKGVPIDEMIRFFKIFNKRNKWGLDPNLFNQVYSEYFIEPRQKILALEKENGELKGRMSQMELKVSQLTQTVASQPQAEQVKQAQDQQAKGAQEKQAQAEQAKQVQDQQTKEAQEKQAQVEQAKQAQEKQAQEEQAKQMRDQQAKEAQEKQVQEQQAKEAQEKQDQQAKEAQEKQAQEQAKLAQEQAQQAQAQQAQTPSAPK